MSAAVLPAARVGHSRGGVAWRAVALGLTLSTVAVAAGFVSFVTSFERSETLPARHGDGIVVLTGGAERVSDALGLLVGGRGDRLLVSGVNPNTSAAELTRAMPEARRLLGCCIELGYRAGDTVGNARETRSWVQRHGIRTLIVVTSNYHMPRALAEMADALPGIDLLPFAVVREHPGAREAWSSPGELRLVAAEYLKYLVVLARTRLHPSGPYDDAPPPA